jgi:hypothetical protein
MGVYSVAEVSNLASSVPPVGAKQALRMHEYSALCSLCSRYLYSIARRIQDQTAKQHRKRTLYLKRDCSRNEGNAVFLQ